MPEPADLPMPAFEISPEYVACKPKDGFLRFFSARHAARYDYAHLSPLARAVLAHTLSTPDGKLVFIKNSKAGCTTIAHLIYLHETGKVAPGIIHHESETLVQGRENWQRNLRALTSGKAVSFSFVRQPLARAVSGFTDFFVERRNPEAPPHVAAIESFGFSLRDDLGYRFDVFLDYVARSLALSPVETDRHWRPQVLNLGRPDFRLRFVGKLENLRADLAKVSEMAGMDLPMPEGLAREKRNRSGDPGFRPNPEQVRRVEDIYAADYEAFGY